MSVNMGCLLSKSGRVIHHCLPDHQLHVTNITASAPATSTSSTTHCDLIQSLVMVTVTRALLLFMLLSAFSMFDIRMLIVAFIMIFQPLAIHHHRSRVLAKRNHAAEQERRRYRSRCTNNQPIATLDRHTNMQDPKRDNISDGANSHKPFVRSGSNVVKVRRDLIRIRHRRHHLLDDAEETKPKDKMNGRVPTPLAIDEAAGMGR